MTDQGLEERRVRVLVVSGSLRAGSGSSAALATARAVAPAGIEVEQYDGMGQLPHFNPDDDADPLDPAVADLRARIAAADALLFSTPEYAGALPGSFKNLLDWTVGGVEIDGKPVGWVNVSTSPGGAADAHASLAKVLGYVGSVIADDACVHLPVPRAAVGPDGLIADEAFRAGLSAALAALAAHVAA